MRGGDARSGALFSYVNFEARVGKTHPLRAIRQLVNEALVALEKEFSVLYLSTGRPSIPPEKLLRAMLLQAFYSIRSERQLMERLEFDLLFRWFVGLGVDDAVWDHSTFSKNRDRLLSGDIAVKFLNAILEQPRVKRLLSTDHFSVDGTLIQAWASMKSFKPKDGADEPPSEGGGRNKEADFHDEKRSNETHASATDPEARLYRKGPGKEAKLCFIGHTLMEKSQSAAPFSGVSGFRLGVAASTGSGSVGATTAVAMKVPAPRKTCRRVERAPPPSKASQLQERHMLRSLL
jgi:transposase